MQIVIVLPHQALSEMTSPPLSAESDGNGLVCRGFPENVSEVEVQALGRTTTTGYGQFALRLDNASCLVVGNAFVHTTLATRAASSPKEYLHCLGDVI